MWHVVKLRKMRVKDGICKQKCLLHIRIIIYLGSSSFNELIKLVTYTPSRILLIIPLVGCRWTCLWHTLVVISLWVSRFDGVDETCI